MWNTLPTDYKFAGVFSATQDTRYNLAPAGGKATDGVSWNPMFPMNTMPYLVL